MTRHASPDASGSAGGPGAGHRKASDVDNLIRMANQISQFHEVMPDHAEAVAGVAEHLRKFWAPPMRARLQQHLADTGGAGLHALVIEALRGAGPGLSAR